MTTDSLSICFIIRSSINYKKKFHKQIAKFIKANENGIVPCYTVSVIEFTFICYLVILISILYIYYITYIYTNYLIDIAA